MTETTEEAVLLAFETRENLFDSIYEMLSSENYVKVLMATEEGMTQSDIAEEVGGRIRHCVQGHDRTKGV